MKKQNYKKFQEIIKKENITALYHFTDFDNIDSIIRNGGLYSWKGCEDNGIAIPKPGGSERSRKIDCKKEIQYFVRLSFIKHHPMMYVAMNEDRITNPVILEIDPEVIFDENTIFSDKNAASADVNIGGSLEDFLTIHFQTVKANSHFNMNEEEEPFFQAEIMVKDFIPQQYIKNIQEFAGKLPLNLNQITANIQTTEFYTAQITRSCPTAFIFMIDQSGSMERTTIFEREQLRLSEAVAKILNRQINELVLRCVKSNETRPYFDIAVIGYNNQVKSAWKGALEGKYFVSPYEIQHNPYRVIKTNKSVITRKGTSIKEVEELQWIEPVSYGLTNMHAAFEKAKSLLENWLEQHKNLNCYPPTIINITDGEFNDADTEQMIQVTNDIKSMYTNDGNVLIFNIHISDDESMGVVFPASKNELPANQFVLTLNDLSSWLPLRYNEQIADFRGDIDKKVRHRAMAVNAGMSALVQIMDIGTPTNIKSNIK